MSTVYLAAQESVNRYVALKVMLPELLSDPDNSKRFLREARIAARFRHPNIISIYDVSLGDGQPFIAMEYVPGGKLDTTRIKSMNLTEKLNVVVQCADAISFLHSQNFIHRDIKPSNILFREDNSIVLTDFGVAHDGSAQSKITQTGFVVGTPHYMSPEQARGIELDLRADIYSLGVLLYRMLAGRVPFSADHPITVCTMHVNAPIPDLPRELARFDPVVKRAMAKRPDDRFNSANDFIDGLIAVTGSDTSRFLKRSMSGIALQEIDAGDMTTPSQLQKSYSNLTKARIEPTLGEPKTVLQPAPFKPVKNNRTDKKSKTKPDRQFPTTLVISLIGLGAVLVALIYFGTQFWDRSPGETESVTIQFENAEKLIETGTRSSLIQARIQYAKILAKDPQNERALKGQEDVKRRFAELDAAAQQTVIEESTADRALQREQEQLQEKIQNLLAMGYEYANAPLEPNQNISPSQPYREVLDLDPDNQRAILGLSGLSERMMTMAAVSLDEGKLETTRWLLDEIGLIGIANLDALTRLETRYSDISLSSVREQDQIQAALQRGYAYLKIDQLSRPADANAISEFNLALSLDSNNPEAQSGLQQVAQRYLVLAESARAKGNRVTAEEYWNQAEAIAPGLPGSAEIRSGINSLAPAPATRVSDRSGVPPGEFGTYQFGNLQITGNESGAELFRLAEMEFNEGNDLRAYGLYKETLKRPGDHSGALRRLNRGAGVYLKYAGRDVSEGNLDSAYTNLVIALTLDPDHPRADSTRRSYLAARQQMSASETQPDNQSDDLVQNMRINLNLKNAVSNHSQFSSDPSNQVAATRAREQYAAILELNSSHNEAKQGLARLCDELISASIQANELAQKDQALWFYQLALEIDPQNPRLTELESLLD